MELPTSPIISLRNNEGFAYTRSNVYMHLPEALKRPLPLYERNFQIPISNFQKIKLILWLLFLGVWLFRRFATVSCFDRIIFSNDIQSAFLSFRSRSNA